LGAVALGLALGATAGILLGRFFSGAATEAPDGSQGAGSVAELVHDALSALENDLQLREYHLDVVPIRRTALEVHGWVPDRQSRLRAQRLVTAAVHPADVINCILVRGEDDLPFDVLDDVDDLDARPA
jgi:hypothetical protein